MSGTLQDESDLVGVMKNPEMVRLACIRQVGLCDPRSPEKIEGQKAEQTEAAVWPQKRS